MRMGGGLTSGSIRSIHTMLHKALSAAETAHLILRNPTEGVPTPKQNQNAMKVLTGEQLDRFMSAIQDDPVWHDLFYTELTTGLHRGKLCGLKWEDFDEESGILKIRRTILKEKAGELTEGETKTGKGRREITLLPSTVELLKIRKQSALTVWIFPDPLHPERPTRPDAAYDRMKTLLKQANLPDIRFHDLRHTFATHALASGVDVKTLSGILGHTKAAFTLDTYTHTTGDMQKRAAKIVETFMTDIFGKELRPWEESAKMVREQSA